MPIINPRQKPPQAPGKRRPEANAAHQRKQRAQRHAEGRTLHEDYHEYSSLVREKQKMPPSPSEGEEDFWQPIRQPRAVTTATGKRQEAAGLAVPTEKENESFDDDSRQMIPRHGVYDLDEYLQVMGCVSDDFVVAPFMAFTPQTPPDASWRNHARTETVDWKSDDGSKEADTETRLK
ncbi:MAG: hypothetical protein Q9171_001308 [Xanthocarpia ochracea]